MGRKNNRNRQPQAQRRADGTRGGRRAGWTPPPPVETLIVPKGRCFFRSRKGKLIFTADEAQKALKQAQNGRQRAGKAYAESRAYPCPEGGCGGFHLTSRETYVERTAS
jgi:hypothetical protein